MGVGGIVGSLFIGAISCRSVFAALVVAPTVVAAGFAILYLAGPHLTVGLVGIALWRIGLALTVMLYQQTILLTGRKPAPRPKLVTSSGMTSSAERNQSPAL